MHEEEILLTQEGFETLSDELTQLKQELPKVVKEVESARASGDLRENAPYHAARDRQARLQGRIEELDHIIKNAKIAKQAKEGIVSIGSQVTVAINGSSKDFTIVGAQESDISVGKISSSSPLGLSLLDKKKGEVVTINISGKEMEYRIIDVS